ncbi:hypothetical protein FKM82_004175 [Ascaphus truei]
MTRGDVPQAPMRAASRCRQFGRGPGHVVLCEGNGRMPGGLVTSHCILTAGLKQGVSGAVPCEASSRVREHAIKSIKLHGGVHTARAEVRCVQRQHFLSLSRLAGSRACFSQ